MTRVKRLKVISIVQAACTVTVVGIALIIGLPQISKGEITLLRAIGIGLNLLAVLWISAFILITSFTSEENETPAKKGGIKGGIMGGQISIKTVFWIVICGVSLCLWWVVILPLVLIFQPLQSVFQGESVSVWTKILMRIGEMVGGYLICILVVYVIMSQAKRYIISKRI